MQTIIRTAIDAARHRPWAFASALLLLGIQIYLGANLCMAATDKYKYFSALAFLLALAVDYLPIVRLAEVFKMHYARYLREQVYANRIDAYLKTKHLLDDPYHQESPRGTYVSCDGAKKFLRDIIDEMAGAGLSERPIGGYAGTLERHFSSYMGHITNYKMENVMRVSDLEPDDKKHFYEALTMLRYHTEKLYISMCSTYNIKIRSEFTYIYTI